MSSTIVCRSKLSNCRFFQLCSRFKQIECTLSWLISLPCLWSVQDQYTDLCKHCLHRSVIKFICPHCRLTQRPAQQKMWLLPPKDFPSSLTSTHPLNPQAVPPPLAHRPTLPPTPPSTPPLSSPPNPPPSPPTLSMLQQQCHRPPPRSCSTASLAVEPAVAAVKVAVAPVVAAP